MNIVITGAPGSGKGTFSNRIKDVYNLEHISTGDIFRENISKQTPLGVEAKKYMDEGHLVPDELVDRMVLATLDTLPEGKDGYLLDGYPRTLEQAQAFDRMTQGTSLHADKILYLDVPHEVLTKRIIGRRTCPDCGEIYNIYFKPAKQEGTCDACGAALTARADDNPESFATRLHEYDDLTQPVIRFYEDQNKVSVINANQGFDEIWNEIVRALQA